MVLGNSWWEAGPETSSWNLGPLRAVPSISMKPENPQPVDHGALKEPHAFPEALGRKKQKGNWKKTHLKPMPESEIKFTLPATVWELQGDKLTQTKFETPGTLSESKPVTVSQLGHMQLSKRKQYPQNVHVQKGSYKDLRKQLTMSER